jgi:prolipoprotein diacylglyceryltransferase
MNPSNSAFIHFKFLSGFIGGRLESFLCYANKVNASGKRGGADGKPTDV